MLFAYDYKYEYTSHQVNEYNTQISVEAIYALHLSLNID